MKKVFYIIAIALLLPACGKMDIPAESTGSQTSKGKKDEFFDAVKNGKLETVQKMFEEGIDINSTDYLGQTALHKAASLGQSGIVEWLISHGADSSRQDSEGNTPLDNARENLRNRTYHALMKHNAPSNNSTMNVAVALYWSDKERALELLRNGADSNAQTSLGHTPLLISTRCRDFLMVKQLIEYGANVNLCSPLYHALAKNNLEIAELLIQSGADVNFRFEKHNTNTGQSETCTLLDISESDEIKALLRSRGAVLGEELKKDKGEQVEEK